MTISGIVDEIVSNSIEALVCHFSNEDSPVGEEPPYFDPLLGRPHVDSTFTLTILESLMLRPQYIVLDWIVGYAEIVSQQLRQFRPGGIAILQHYEWILAKCLDETGSMEQGALVGRQRSIFESLKVLSQDFHHLSNQFKTIPLSDYTRSNIVAPILLRLMSHCWKVLAGTSNDFQADEFDLAGQVATLLVPTIGMVDPGKLSAGLNTADFLEDLKAVIPKPLLSDSLWNLDFSHESLRWIDLVLNHCSIYSDNVTGIMKRTTATSWKLLVDLVTATNGEPETEEAREAWSEETLQDVARRAIHLVGISAVVNCVQSSFFWEYSDPDYKEMPPSIQVIHGRRVEGKPKPVVDKTYKAEASRVLSAINLISLLREGDVELEDNAASQLVSICLELVDSTNKVYTAIGAAGVLRLMSIIDSKHSVWTNMGPLIMSRLQSAFMVNSEGSAVLVIGRAQHRLLRLMKYDRSSCQSLCKQWLTRLQRTAHLPTQDDINIQVLSGGLLPLLVRLAVLEDAPGMEIGRPGLPVFLPVIVQEYTSTETRVATILGLMLLMISGYPMMPHHGEKIICHLLHTSVQDETSVNGKVEGLQEIATAAASMCLVICGESAKALVKQMKTQENKYQQNVLDRITQIENLAEALKS